MNNMLTLEEVKRFLEIEQEELEKYLKQGKLHAYKIGGTFLRFRKEEVINLRFQVQPSQPKASARVSIFSHIADFWRFNNFYIISLVLVVVLIVLAIKF